MKKTIGDDPCGAIPVDVQMWRAGLSKRESFAAMLLQGLLSNPATASGIEIRIKGKQKSVGQAEAAVQMADELIRALNAEGTELGNG